MQQSLVVGGSAAAVANAIYNNWVAAGAMQSNVFFVDFKNTGVNTVVQDQIAAVPVPAALFFVAPALIGVLGGMRRKSQGMAA